MAFFISQIYFNKGLTHNNLSRLAFYLLMGGCIFAEMDMARTYNPRETEDKWYAQWLQHRVFESKPDSRPSFTVVMPPPNVTGVLHMGHMLNCTVQDIIIRRARMQGYNACWVPGTDHASIATEAKVVSMLGERGIKKNDLSRDEFLSYAWEWKEKYGGIILEQLKKLGASVDWKRVAFTMDTDYYNAVIDTFIDLYNKGYIYRGSRIVNWDPKAKTAVSDEEVNYKEVKSKLFYVKYSIDELPGEFITIATTRPETIMGDTAVCVHPEDERYKHLVGKHAIIPLVNRKVPIIADDYIDITFGTGALKVTPAHDINDFNLGIKHNLPVIDTLNDDGTLSAAAQVFVGLDRFEARKKVPVELEKLGLLVKVEEITNNNGFSERTNAVIEPRLTMQWWCKMPALAQPALHAVMNDDVHFYPAKYKNTYRHWMENIKDWCISRQLWWGHRIPAWYAPTGEMVVAKTAEEAFSKLKLKNQNLKIEDISQDDDVLDTWFSSWLWPMEVFKGITNPGNAELKYYYPTNTLVTAPEIIFFWVARMIMAGFEYERQLPFSNVYFTGIVRDKQGRKMSKSLGNSPDVLKLMEDYGADGVRFGVLISSPAGNDIMFDEKQCEQGRNFNNKLWNALRLVKGWETKQTEMAGHPAVEWMEAQFNFVLKDIDSLYDEFNLNEVLKRIYSLIWDDFCSWYLEWVKPNFGDAIDAYLYEKTVSIFENLLKILHPFMPFATEEFYQALRQRNSGDFICISAMPKPMPVSELILNTGDSVKQLITQVRDLRNKHQLKPKETVGLAYMSNPKVDLTAFRDIIIKACNLSSYNYIATEPKAAIPFFVRTDQYYFIHSIEIDPVKERARLEDEIKYTEGFLDIVHKKLTNQKFMANAQADVLEKERKKQADAEQKLKQLKESLSALSFT